VACLLLDRQCRREAVRRGLDLGSSYLLAIVAGEGTLWGCALAPDIFGQEEGLRLCRLRLDSTALGCALTEELLARGARALGDWD